MDDQVAPTCDSVADEARRHARRMLDAEVELGRVVVRIGVEHAGELADAIGVSRGMLVKAALRASQAVRPHGPLERKVVDKKAG